MIVEMLDTMQSLLEARQQRRSEKGQLDSLKVFSDDLAQLTARWDQIVSTAPFLGVDRTLMRRVAEQVPILVKRVPVATPRDDLIPLRRLIEELERDALVRWDNRKHQWTRSALLNHARILVVISTPDVKARIAPLMYRLDNALQQNTLPSPSLVTMLETIQHQLKGEIAAALPPIDPEVEEFLAQLADGAASLEHVTPRILEWCRQQRLAGRIVLSISGG